MKRRVQEDPAIKGAGKGAIILHGETRFAGVYYCLKRLLNLKSVLQVCLHLFPCALSYVCVFVKEIVFSRAFAERNFTDAADMKAKVMNDGNWEKMKSLLTFLKPLKCYIRLVDHACNTTEHVAPAMMKVCMHGWMDGFVCVCMCVCMCVHV